MTTHVHEPVIRPNSEIAERAREVHPVQFTRWLLLTIVASLFTIIGWSAGTLWFVVTFSTIWAFSRSMFLGQCVRYGFHKGARVKLVDKQAE